MRITMLIPRYDNIAQPPSPTQHTNFNTKLTNITLTKKHQLKHNIDILGWDSLVHFVHRSDLNLIVKSHMLP